VITGKTIVAGVVGRPVAHSLSPLLHNAWLAACGIDGVYVTFAPDAQGFKRFADGMRGGAIRGVNVTVPFKETALQVADRATARAEAAGAANILLFETDGRTVADNTDGLGLMAAFALQAPDWQPSAGPVAVFGAGGAARGAVAALLERGAPRVFVVNRTLRTAEVLAAAMGSRVAALPLSHAAGALRDATAVINATTVGLDDDGDLNIPLSLCPANLVVMDMVYKPLETQLLRQARDLGRTTVDGLEMLLGQARPSFDLFFGQPPPLDVDVRALALKALSA